MFRKGLLLVVCGPSGVGKGTILKYLVEGNECIRFSVSATTRNPRIGEVDGKNYFFKTREQFTEMIGKNELVEWVEYCGNYYGTPKKYIEESIEQGFDIILEIEVDGAANIKGKYPDAVSIFILPPTFEDLRKRIEGRGTEKPDVIEERLERAKTELTYVNRYDYIIINDQVEKAVNEIKHIIIAEKLKFSRNKDILTQIGLRQEDVD